MVYNIALKGDKDAKVPKKIKKIIVKLRKYLLIPVNYYIGDDQNFGEDNLHLEPYDEEETKRYKATRLARKRRANWLLLAAVIDRFLFFMYLLSNIFLSIFILISPI